MNVLILTPDRVGSTLLQRLITIYMAFHEFDRPVINLHELTNGIIKYYSNVFNTEVLGKGNGDQWGYYQKLPEIVDLLKSVDHYKTSRLALYHLQNRKDSIEHQLQFYRYLNENFFIISARRENLLEHVLSWGIVTHTKKLNVYSANEKYQVFSDLYKNKITLDRENIEKYLDRYRDYLQWTNDHFDVGSYFTYEKHLKNIEEYVLKLPIFNNQPKISWKDKFDIEFDDWNKVQYLFSDLSGLSSQVEKTQLLLTDQSGNTASPNFSLTVSSTERSELNLSKTDLAYVSQYAKKVYTTKQHLRELVDNKILVTPPPVKLQTMVEKKLIIENYQDCVNWYNDWVTRNGIGTIYQDDELARLSYEELKEWHAPPLKLG